MSTALLSHASRRTLLNVGLRGLTLSSRFLLLFALARWLSPAELGLFGLVSTIVGYGIYLVGLEFYAFATRELIRAAPSKRAGMLGQQLMLHGSTYLLGALLLVAAERLGWTPSGYLGWLCALLLLEQLAQELHRILVALSRQLTASWVLFVRTGSWCLVVIAVLASEPSMRQLGFVLAAWTVGASIACLIGLVALLRALPPGEPVRWQRAWLVRGLKVALPFFIATLAARGLSTFDRFFVEEAAGLELLGAYVLYASLGVAVLAFLDAGVVDFAYPRLVALVGARDKAGFEQEMRQVRRRVLAMGGVLILGAALAAQLLAQLLGRELYQQQLHLVYGVLAVAALNALSLVPQLGLYALRQDRAILVSQLLGLAAFVLVAWLALPAWGVYAVLLGLGAAWAIILAWKAVAYRRVSLSFNW